MNHNSEISENPKNFFSKISEFIEEYKIQRPTTSKLVMLTIAACLLAMIILFAHYPTINCKADSFDDYQYAFNNNLVKNPSLISVKRFFTEILNPTTVEGYYQPLAMVSLMIDCAFGASQENMAVFHITSLLIHIINSILVLLIIYMLFNKKIWIAFIGGVLFGIHPVSVEEIAWLSERKSVLATLFLLLSLLLYIVYVKSSKKRYKIISLLIYVLALLSKPIAVSLPVILLLLDYLWYNRLKLATILDKIPYFAIAFIFTVIAYISQKNTATVSTATLNSSIFQAFLLVCYNNIFYLWKIFFPTKLSPFYEDIGAISLSNSTYLISFILTILIIIFFIITWKRTKLLLFGYLFYLTSILPTSGVIKVTNAITCYKYAYLPSIGVLFIVLVLINELSKLKKYKQPIICLVIFALVFSISAGELSASYAYASKWEDTETLNKHMLDVNPKSPTILNSLARTYMLKLDFDKAFECLEKSLEIDPNSGGTHIFLAAAYQLVEKEAEAVAMYKKALELGAPTKSTTAIALCNLGKIYLSNEYFEEAKHYFEDSIKFNPIYLPSYCQLAITENRLGNFEEAVLICKDLINNYPMLPTPYIYLGIIYAENEKYNEAITYLNHSITINPYDSFAYYTLGNILANFGKFDDAEMCYKESIRLEPNKVDVYNDYARLCAQQGKFEEALNLLRKSLSFSDYSETYILLGDVYKDLNDYEKAINSYKKALEINPSIDFLPEMINSLKEKIG